MTIIINIKSKMMMMTILLMKVIIRWAFGPRRVRPRAQARVVLFPLIVRVGAPQGPRRPKLLPFGPGNLRPTSLRAMATADSRWMRTTNSRSTPKMK